MGFTGRKLLNFIGRAALALAGFAGGAAPAQVLNLSHDLVAKGIAPSNMTPDMPSLDARPLFQAGVAYASAHNIPLVTADRGSYYFLTLNSEFQHVYLNQISNVTVDLAYSDLYFAEGNIMAIDANNCVNLTLQNFTVDYQRLPFTQLEVTGVDTAAKTIGIQQLGSYPLPSTFNGLTVPPGFNNDGFFVYVFRHGKQLSGTGRMGVNSANPLTDTLLTLAGTEAWTTAAQLGTIQAGDTLVLEFRAGTGTLFLSNSTGTAVRNVSVYASGFIGVLTYFSTATTVDHVQVIPRPGTDRLISTNADGIHLGKTGANNVVTNNTVKRTCDDAIAMDGEWSATVAAPSSTATVQVKRFLQSPLPVGGMFDFISIVDGAILGTATILSENPAPGAQTGKPAEPIALTLDHAISGLQANFGVTAHDANLRGGGTVISGNLAEEITFGRGIYPAGVGNVTIRDNVTEATNRTGIVVEQDEALVYGYKTGPSSGIDIENNVVDNALNFGVPSGPLLMDAAGINVIVYDQYFAWVATQPLTNITVNNNFITNCIRSGIRVENVNGGAASGNTLRAVGTQPDSDLWYLPACAGCESQAQVEAEFAEPVVVSHAVGVTDTNNAAGGTPVIHRSKADGSYRLAPWSIAVAEGQNLAVSSSGADGRFPPQTVGGAHVSVKDSAGVTRPAAVLAVSATRVTYLVPQGTAPGVATVTVGSQTGGALISSVGPALFSADGTGSGVALAAAIRTTGRGQRMPESVYRCAASICTAVPLDLGKPGDRLVVHLLGTGIRGRSSLANVVAEVGGAFATVDAASPLPFAVPGLDGVAIEIPHSLAGAGVVPIVLTVDGFTANVVTVSIK